MKSSFLKYELFRLSNLTKKNFIIPLSIILNVYPPLYIILVSKYIIYKIIKLLNLNYKTNLFDVIKIKC
jgi:hypothetical protein